MSSFKENLKSEMNLYLQKTNECNRLQQELAELKDEKQEYEKSIIQILKSNNQENKTFLLNDVKIAHRTFLNYQQLSLKFLQQCLEEYTSLQTIKGEKKINVEDVLSFIKEKRDKKQKEELKILNT